MFDLFTAGIAILVVGGTLWGGYRRNDTFHPLVYLLPMGGVTYVLIPSLLSENELFRHFTHDELVLVQGLNFACLVALVCGVIVGDRGLQRDSDRQDVFSATLTPVVQDRLHRMAVTIGFVGVLIFVYGLMNVGGFVAAFDSPKGGGWAATGWLRDLKLLVIPGIILLYMSRKGRRWTPATWGWLALFSLPLLSRSFLATSRGWTFMGAVAIVAGGYLVYNRRPQFPTLLAGGTLLGLLMLIMVTYRGEIYIGSDFFAGDRPSLSTMVEESLDRFVSTGVGNEFVYGTYTVLLAQEENDHYWGRRYLVYTVIRPIPSLIWPNKYTALGTEGIRFNAGTMGEDQSAPIYEQFPNGMAPGIVGDLFVEFSWGAIPAAFLFGWVFGVGWRRFLVEGGIWTIVYLALFAFSVFAMMQTVPAAFFSRFLIVVVPTVLLWWRWIPDRRTRLSIDKGRIPALS